MQKTFINIFIGKLTAVIYMSNQRLYWKLMTLALIMLLIICSGDVETNPGPKKNIKISLCHRNFNGIAAWNLSKVSLLQAMATTHEYDIICLSGTFLGSSFNSLDDLINIEGYNNRADHPNDNRRRVGGVCMYILKNSFEF